MRLAAIYNLWDGLEWLDRSMRSVEGSVDQFILVWQSESNFGEHYDNEKEIKRLARRYEAIEIFYEPVLELQGTRNEIRKRSTGLKEARDLDCTHFLFMDSDELYDPYQFAGAKEHIILNDYDGSVCRLYTYYKKETWKLKPLEDYYVPFIHKIKPKMEIGQVRYPYKADPTRKVGGVEKMREFKREELMMHHYSWVRDDIGRKLRNSSARVNWPDRIDEMQKVFENSNELVYLYNGYQLDKDG